MLKFVRTPACKPCRAFVSKSLDIDDGVDGFYHHSALEGRRSISFDNIHALTRSKHRQFSSSGDDEDDNDDTMSVSGSYNPLMVSGSYNTLQPHSLNAQNFNTLKMMVSMFKPRTTDGCNIDHGDSTNYRESVREGRHSVPFYMNQLCRHLDSQMRMRSPPKKLLKGLISIEKLLTSLEVDLRSNPNATWLREFIDEPNCGHVVLLKFLKYLQEYSSSGNSTLERGYKNKKSEQLLAKEPTAEHSCLLCLKAIVRNKYGFHKVLSAPRSLSTMVYCLRLSNIKTKIAVLKILSEACEHPGGFEKTLQAFEDYKQVKKERFRFESVVHSVIFRGRLNNPMYMETVLHFFNALLRNAPTLNQRVFHQQELEQAGFTADKVEQTLDGLNADGLREELSKWRNNYIDVASTLDEYVSLRGRSTMLRDEVDLLQGKVEQFQRERNSVLMEKQELEKKLEEYKIRASEFQLRIEKIKRHHPENTSDPSDITHAIQNAVEEILRPSTPTPPPPPPRMIIPPPPLPPPLNLSASKDNGIQFRKSAAKLPMLHWQAIPSPSHNSVFSTFSPNALENKINFEEFDKLFEMKKSASNTLPRDAAAQKLTNQVTILNSNKARSLLIARKRINLPEHQLQRAIDGLDIVQLPPEYLELLVKFTPTAEERVAMKDNMSEYDKMADAEKFMVQLMKIDRLESKLNAMLYMGTFDELFRITSPQIEAIISASVSLATSSKLRQILEVILALGNYMNGGRRGFTKAFKLESLVKLEEVKSSNKQISLLQYIVTVVQSRFPELQNFFHELDVQPTLSISMETLAADVQNLRKGLDVAKMEKEKQPDNYALHNFYDRAVLKVQQVGERYRKMEEHYRDVCTMFCENPKTTEPSVFFFTFHKFIESYKTAKKQLDAQHNEEKALKKAKLLRAQNQKLKETATLNYKMVGGAVVRRHSEFFDQNQNVLQRQPMGSTMSLNVNNSCDRLSMSCPRSLYENMRSIDSNVKERNELDNCPLFQRTKQCNDSDIPAEKDVNVDNTSISPQTARNVFREKFKVTANGHSYNSPK